MLSRRLLLALLCLIAMPALAAPTQRPLDPDRPDAAATTATMVRADESGIELRLELGQVEAETISLAGRQWTALDLVDGSHEGEPGQPALPVWTTLIVVPDGASLQATATAGRKHALTGLDLQPWQPLSDGDAAAPVVDAAWYAAGGRCERELVSVGEPARMGGVTVAPVMVRPVSYDAATRTATVAETVNVQLTWSDGRTADPGRVSPAMQRLLADAALNWPETPMLVDGGGGVHGTWVAIIPAISSVREALTPLVDWRQRQGYKVIVADLNETGPTPELILAYLQNLYDTLEAPLEFVTLVGDGNGSLAVPTWREGRSGYQGEGDHYYTLLDGADQLPDIHAGRLSCRNISELNGIVAKIVAYETDPPRASTDWFERGLVVGDPEDSGMSTVFCARWLADQLYAVDYERVYTIFSGNFLDQMIAEIDAGRSVFGYRGFYGMSGFNSGHASILSNGGMLPFSIFPTCDTGSFLVDTNCRSEALLRAPNGGSIGAVGTATSGTHTRYNNCFFYGVFEGLLHGTDHRQGAAMTRSRLELFRNYGVNEPNVVEIWSTWNSLMGDPATDIWLGVPSELEVSYPSAVPLGAGSVPVTVMAGGVPVVGAHVAAVANDGWRSTLITDDAGQVLLPMEGVTASQLHLTVSGHGLIPYRGFLTVADQDHWVALDAFELDGDGVAVPAENLGLTLTLRNLGQQTADQVTATVTSRSAWLTVTAGSVDFGTIVSGATATGAVPAQVVVAPNAPDGAVCQLGVVVSSATGTWESQLVLTVAGSDLAPADPIYSAGAAGPGVSTEIIVAVSNDGSLPMGASQAWLRTRSLWVTLTDSTGSYGAIPVGGQADNAGDTFAVTFAADMVDGSSVPLTLVLEDADGMRRRMDFSVPVGTRTAVDPTGPDAYGYYAFDDGDVGYAETRAFDWVEIDPDRGGPGTLVGLSDFSYEQDDVELVDLPFPFRYYGQEFATLTVCSNGWVSFDEEAIPFWRNWNVPAAGSPDAMIAVFWDDLRLVASGKVYHWYDAAENRYIVQWSRMPNLLEGVQTCQLILLDPAHYPTLSLDGIIVCQYLDVDNNDHERNYATLGIQSPGGTDGVCYSYYATEPPGGVAPHGGMAITYVPKGRREPITCEVSPGVLEVTLPVGGQQDHTLYVANDGELGTPLMYEIVQVDPVVGQPGAKDMTGCTVSVDQTGFLPGEPLDIQVTLYNGSPDNEWIEAFLIELPEGVNLIGGTDLFDGTHSLFWQDGAGDGADAHWVGQGADMINQYQTAVGTFTIQVDYGMGDLDLPWTMNGDVYGAPPHDLTGTIHLSADGNLLNILSPDGGEFWSLGEERQVTWENSPDVTDLSVELSRDDGATWDVIAASVPSADGFVSWIVTEPVSGQCLVRVTSLDNALVTDASTAPFTIQNDLSWLALDAMAGEVIAGNTAQHALHFDATGLVEGSYYQILRVDHNAGPPIIVPVTLIVDGTSGTDQVPLATTLAQNHPNPFNPSTRIEFALARGTRVDLAVFDLTGRRLARLISGDLASGRHTVLWDGRGDDGRGLPSGTYLYRLVTGDEVFSRKLTLLK